MMNQPRIERLVELTNEHILGLCLSPGTNSESAVPSS